MVSLKWNSNTHTIIVIHDSDTDPRRELCSLELCTFMPYLSLRCMFLSSFESIPVTVHLLHGTIMKIQMWLPHWGAIFLRSYAMQNSSYICATMCAEGLHTTTQDDYNCQHQRLFMDYAHSQGFTLMGQKANGYSIHISALHTVLLLYLFKAHIS